MGIKSDLEEYRALWNQGSWGVRGLDIVQIVQIFIAVGSLATLSDAIFKFRGFMRDGIQLYEEFIRHPLMILLSSIFNIRLNSLHFDFLVWWALVSGALYRSHLTTGENGKALGTVLSFIIGMALAINVIPVNAKPLSPSGLIIVVGGYIICTWYISTNVKNKSVFYVFVLTPILIVAVLGAVSSGISRPL
jgi:hypothetical protein